MTFATDLSPSDTTVHVMPMTIIRAEVESEFSVRLSTASNAERKRIRSEIETRNRGTLNALARRIALY